MASSLIVHTMIGAIATLVSGIGGVILTLWVTRRREQKKEVQDIIADLQRIKSRLEANHAIYHELEDGRGEHPLDKIDNVGFPAFYHGLSDASRKTEWKLKLNNMRDNNKEILNLLNKLTGKAELSGNFNKTSDEFKNHERQWDQFWQLAMELKQEQKSKTLDQKQQRNRRRFPDSFALSLETEIDRLQR